MSKLSGLSLETYRLSSRLQPRDETQHTTRSYNGLTAQLHQETRPGAELHQDHEERGLTRGVWTDSGWRRRGKFAVHASYRRGAHPPRGSVCTTAPSTSSLASSSASLFPKLRVSSSGNGGTASKMNLDTQTPRRERPRDEGGTRQGPPEATGGQGPGADPPAGRKGPPPATETEQTPGVTLVAVHLVLRPACSLTNTHPSFGIAPSLKLYGLFF